MGTFGCLCEKCWKGYEKKGMKKMFGKMYPNCVKKESMTEDGHTDVASAKRAMKVIAEDAIDMFKTLKSMNDEGSLPSWWMNKIAIAANSMNKLRDYLLVPSTNEDFDKINRERSRGSRHVAKGDDKDKGTIEDMKRQIQMLKIELENEKNKSLYYRCRNSRSL